MIPKSCNWPFRCQFVYNFTVNGELELPTMKQMGCHHGYGPLHYSSVLLVTVVVMC